MEKILGVFIVLDIVSQLFIDMGTAFGWIYYDLIHYGVLLSISLFYAIMRLDKLIGYFSIYFAYCFGNILYHIPLSREDYIENISLDYTSFGYLCLIILVTFIIKKKWLK